MRRVLIAGAVAVVAVALFAPATAAHVQVLPARAAPGDPTLFNVLVPNEADASTVRVELKIPAGVLPFSFQETPGWKRSETRAANGSLDVVTWNGDLPAGEFVVFSFLATTPDQEGEVSWPAIQTYGDGTKVRWIGPADSDEPAPTTLVSSDVAPQNAGGEGAAAETADTSGQDAAPAPASTDAEESTDVLSVVALALAGAALVAALLAVVLVRRRPAGV